MIKWHQCTSVLNILDFLEYSSLKFVHQIISDKKMSYFEVIKDLKRQSFKKQTVPGSNMARCFEPSVLDNLDFSEFLSKPKLLVPNPRRLFQTIFGFFLGVHCPCPKIKFQWRNFRLLVIPNHGIPWKKSPKKPLRPVHVFIEQFQPSNSPVRFTGYIVQKYI